MKKLLIILLISSAHSITYAQYDEKAKQVLDEMSEKYSKIESYSADITSSMVNEDDGIDEEFSGEITVKNNMFKLQMDEQVIFNDGETVWTYLTEINEVNIDYHDPDEDNITPSKIYNEYKKGYKYLHLGEETMKGVLCDVVELVPEEVDGKQFFKIRMFISQKDRSLVSWIMFEKYNTQYQYTISNFKEDIDVSASDFKFDTSQYPGVEVIDLR